ncbi:MAG: hypothetical protein KJ728_00165 [Alphaproteobacteria bacterium]|uniref:DUF6607 family protein n=1 Tax=Brevundimonas sp. TaxID=1871086 RepID=UPI001D398897|nr:hypothetical protein [Alphaproteobacteria bacterium]MBU1519819.1 hypothetical protein [Alphaproteobacteria bacterium]MBU2031345.1 hypothetical protein [Alphaproteobacteria bacterium]MBU2163373.1 hypothetical protein [Alphaproteobacteria bacterium]MBU2230672.1 hypothetical protein [Alphaproteobacteria bacterium]
MRAILIAAALLTAAAPAAQALEAGAVAQTAASTPASAFERDRQSILAQAGQYRVHFDMRENVSFQADYDPLEEQLSGGSEIVRVVYDQGDRISLQHILVMEHEGQVIVIKHWRQDWVYQPQTVLTYAGPNQWVLTPVPADQRQGAWSQTVWQTDDSPRYGGVGRWTYDNGLSAWTSNPTWRPLARRDAVRNPVYDRYLGTNRHILTPNGWVHIQDNVKMSGKAGGEPVAVVQEDVINTYDRSTGYSPQAGDDYWAKTQGFWAAVRQAWDDAVVAGNGVHLQQEAQTGSVTGAPLMDLAQSLADGETTEADAIAQARVLIAEATSAR